MSCFGLGCAQKNSLENTLLPVHPKALLALADGTVFIGSSIGAPGQTTGEVVFNTSLTGYQEILTDPSYCQQIVTLTYPHIGNTGVNPEDVEANRIHAAGLIIKNLPLLASNFRSTETLSQYLVREHTVAIADIDTRALTRRLRTHGAQNGCILALSPGEGVTDAHRAQAIAAGAELVPFVLEGYGTMGQDANSARWHRRSSTLPGGSPRTRWLPPCALRLSGPSLWRCTVGTLRVCTRG